MSNSPLAEFHMDSPTRYTRTSPIYNIIPHHAGTVNCPEIEHFKGAFMTPGSGKSAHYVVGVDGRIGQYLDEAYGACTTSDMSIDKRSITIEVCNDGGAPDWHVSDAALESLINLCVDICRRNPTIGKLNFTGDKSGNLLMHKWFAPTGCPGDYLASKFPYIAEEVNRRLGLEEPEQPSEEAPAPEEEEENQEPAATDLAVGDEVRLVPGAVYTTGKEVPDWVINSTLYVRAIQGDVITVSIFKEGAVTGPVSREYILKEGAPVTQPETPAPEEPVPDAPEFTPFQVQADTPVALYCAPGIYTIVEESGGFGKLESGEGWVDLSQVRKI